MTFSELPHELVVEILCFLDGRSLARSELVCKRWNELNRSKAFCDVWKQKCAHEIPQAILEEILEKRGDIKYGNICWKETFGTWYRTRHVKRWPYVKKTLTSCDPIQCICVDGNVIVTGHRTGHVNLWESNGTCRELFKHRRVAVGVNIIRCYLKSDLVVVVSISHDFSITVSFVEDGTVIRSLVFNQHGVHLKFLSVYGNKFAVFSADNSMSVWEVDCNEHKVKLLSYVSGASEYACSVSLWSNKDLKRSVDMKIMSCTGQVHTYSLENECWDDTSRRIKTISDCEEFDQLNFMCGWTFRNHISIYTTPERWLCILVNSRMMRVYTNVMSMLRTYVTSVCLSSSLLCIGMENGSVFIYWINDDDELLELDIDKPLTRVNVSEASVISLSISDYGRGPVVAMATSDAVHLLKYVPPQRKNSGLYKTRFNFVNDSF